MKRSHNFAITLNHVDFDKTCFGDFMVASGQVKRLAVGEEFYHSSLDPLTGESTGIPEGKHQHIFVEFIEGYELVEVREMVVEFLCGELDRSIDIQVCRSPKSWLIYLSKDDCHPYLFNVRVSELSLYARAVHHARTRYSVIRPIDKADPFIVSSGQNARFVVGIIEDQMDRLRYAAARRRIIHEPNRRCSQVLDVMSGLNHLYIEGPPGYGKTELVDYLLFDKRVYKVGFPSQFMFGTLDEDYEVIWFEDFVIDKFEEYMPMLLSLMDHKPITISQKFKDNRTITFKGQIIFISNFPIGFNREHFTRRIKHVYFQHNCYQCLGCIQDYVPADMTTGGDIDPGNIFADIEELLSGSF